MKVQKKVELEFAAIRGQYAKIRSIASHTKARHLWQQEAAVRERIKALQRMRTHAPHGYDRVYADYAALLEELSRRILDSYNEQRGTSFRFEEVVKGHFKAYLSSGVLSVLMASHIPHLLSDAFNRCLPANPKDEYPAARAVRRHIVLHLGETNTGKTYQAIRRLIQRGEGVYLAPLRVLALENFESMNVVGARCSLLTGEEEICVDGARLISCTVEKLNLERRYPVAVIDEVQMLKDSQRGAAWVRALLGLNCPEIHVCGALNAREQLIRMVEDCGDTYEFHEYTRAVPLSVEGRPVDLAKVRAGDALIAFSKKRVIALAEYLEGRGIPAAVIYGDLPPEVRRMQYSAFLSGEKRVLVSTDAIGMGVNLPIRRIVFTELAKFDGEEVRMLSSQEVKQIAGRAGRLGIYDVGYVAAAFEAQAFLEAQLDAEDAPVEQAFVGPSEALLSIGILPLREKLALWSTREEALPHYRKMDVRDQLLVLDRIAPYRLPEKVQWQLIMLPFDVHSEERMSQFLNYVEARFIRREKALLKPVMEQQDLSYLEGYYQAVNLYYAFSRAFSLPFDEAWVYEVRRDVSHRINRQLNKTRTLIRKAPST
ncbi:MAG: ski2-like helicase [Firmicutes bacterium ADurb.Bin467]|nr:MAG: ski2-like helicase [Firmicutes bacterium ADurb.Bin467]